MGVKILVAGSGNGKGIAVKNKAKRETFMKMLELQAGLGMGMKKFSVIFVFDNEKVFNRRRRAIDRLSRFMRTKNQRTGYPCDRSS
jgi:hypothetical protein